MSCKGIAGLNIDAALGVRDSIGAVLKPVALVTRVWTGTETGDGEMQETVEDVLPSPGIRDYSHSTRLQEGGAIKQGDLILTMLSKTMYPKESDVDCSTDAPLTERLYRVGDDLYRVISVKEYLLYWNVQVRRLTDQRRS